MQRFIILKKHNNESVTIWGTGKVRREFMYIRDFIDFLYFSIKKFELIPNVLNVGLGYDNSIEDYYKTIFKVIKYRGKINYDLTKPDGIKKINGYIKFEETQLESKNKSFRRIKLNI